jgi:hypothetical protein
MRRCDVAIIHHPSIEVHSAISELNRCALAIWVTWGGDIYNSINSQLLKEKTRELKDRYKTRKQGRKLNILKAKLLNDRYYLYFEKDRVNLNRFNVICGFPKEVKLLSSVITNTEVIYLPPLFPALAENLGSLDSPFAEGSKVLISNSSTIENNLPDACFQLRSHNNLVAIVSYPVDDWQVFQNQEIQTAFPHVHLIRDYMDTETWKLLFDDFDSIYFATLRNLGFINILQGIQKGLKIYLDRENPVYDFLQSKGFLIFSLEEFQAHSKSQFKLSPEIKVKNREKLHRWISVESYAEVEELIHRQVGGEK